MSREHRRAGRIAINIPIRVEKLAGHQASVHPDLAAYYERIAVDEQEVGSVWEMTLRNLSSNGAFIADGNLPLLSRAGLAFELDGFGPVEGIGWVLWRRTQRCVVRPPPETGITQPVELAAGFGILFESIPLDARVAIARRVRDEG